LKLPAYSADSRSGLPHDPSRGCSNSNACQLAPFLWPQQAALWYAAYEQHFWQHDWLAAGFREFPREDTSKEWFFDVDAGPVIRGNGFAACAFGIAAARRNGRFDHAYPLSIEMVAMSWPLPNALLIPRRVSNAANAPYLGEAAILFQLTAQPLTAQSIRHHQGSLPALVWIVLAFYLVLGLQLLNWAYRTIRPRVKPVPTATATASE